MNNIEILDKLKAIVGSDFASTNAEELYIYSMDPGASLPRTVDFVVMPNKVEQVQEIVRMANELKIPLIPMGGGLTLSGLVIPVKGGIVLDMKRMDKIIEINEKSRYAVIEAGVTTGQLMAYLNRTYPELEASIPDAPPSVTVAGNTLIHGSGYLSQKHGNHGDMINALEVVLANGEILKLGSAAISDYWFSRGPIPDLLGMFISAFGTLGIIIKLSIKLFPKPKLRDICFGLIKDVTVIPEAIYQITHLDVPEDILLGKADKPDWMKGYIFIIVYITGDSQEELDSQQKIIKKIYRKNGARFMNAPPRIREIYLEKPQFAATAADFRKGGGFEYVGSFMPLEKIPDAIEIASKISIEHDIVPTLGCRVIGKGHSIMFFASYSFNRADPEDMANARDALHKTNKMVLDLGGIPWKAELEGQKLILEKMDQNYKKLFSSIRKILDPNNIMNPGNWEEK